MLGDSRVVVGSSGEIAATASESHDGGGEAGMAVGSNSGEEGDRSFGGNRWPRQETLALLKIRSDMDVAFRDATVKGPLWEEVARKLSELGYNRSAKKCKEKFENVYKYHKRTKEGRTGKQEGKTYRFFDQLEALDQHHPISPPPNLQPPPAAAPSVAPQPPSAAAITAPPIVSHITVPSTSLPPPPPPPPSMPRNVNAAPPTTTINLAIPSFSHPTNPTILIPPPIPNPTNPPSQPHITSSFTNISADLLSNSTSSSTSSDVELEGRKSRKRKWKDFFERLMKEVMDKQEELQRKFLEALEKRDHERMLREEAWRKQEMARINREREILAQERSMAGAKDAAVMAFLQKLSEQQNPTGQSIQINVPPIQPQPPPPPPQPEAPPRQSPAPAPPPPVILSQPAATNLEIVMKADNGDQNFLPPSSSRWPKVEVEALIRLRTNLESKYQENGPKGPLWEEISTAMRKIGYNRSAKRCKEKWENINKYFKKVKESNKKRPEDSKTCPYFHQLDALYREKNKHEVGGSSNSSQLFKPENSVPLMVRPEQQWPPQPDHHQNQHDSVMEDMESEHMDQNEDDDDDDDKDMGDDDEDQDDEGGADGYEIVPNKGNSVSTAESSTYGTSKGVDSGKVVGFRRRSYRIDKSRNILGGKGGLL